MKKYLTLFVMLIVAAVSAQDAFAAKKVAVYVEGEISKSAAAVVNSAMTSRISGSKDYTVFERSEAFVNALTREQDYQMSGEVPESQIRSVGERMGVDVVIVVEVSMDDEECNMSARMLDLESGKVLKSVSADRKGTGNSTIRALANNCAFRLISKQSK